VNVSTKLKREVGTKAVKCHVKKPRDDRMALICMVDSWSMKARSLDTKTHGDNQKVCDCKCKRPLSYSSNFLCPSTVDRFLDFSSAKDKDKEHLSNEKQRSYKRIPIFQKPDFLPRVQKSIAFR